MWVKHPEQPAPMLVNDATLPYWRGLGWVEWEPDDAGGGLSDAELAALVQDGGSATGAALRAAYGRADRAIPAASTATTIGPYWVTDQPGTSRTSHVTGGAIGDLRLVYPMWVSTPNGPDYGDQDATNAAPVPIRAAIEFPAGTITPVFFGGRREGALDNGATLTSDPVGVDIPANTQFWVRTYLNPAAGDRWPQVVNSSGNTAGEGFAAGDLTAAGSAAIARSDSYLMRPVAVLGRTTATRAVALVGDSIMAGQGDTTTVEKIAATSGFAARALTPAGITWASIALPGESAGRSFVNSPTGHIRRLPVVADCTSALCNYGVNDLLAGLNPTFDAVAGALAAVWKILVIRGMKVWQTTITPFTTSTDGWATVEGQTIDPGRDSAVRIAVNDWIRAGAPLDPTALTPVAVGTTGALLAGQTGHWLSGYFDAADAVETARNSGIWQVGCTADGVHPTPEGHGAMATTVDPAAFV